MGRRCCIAGCTSTSRLPEHQGVTYHSFPLDPAIRAIWTRNTRLSADRTITKSVLVCSRHFRRADFQPQRSGKFLLKQRMFPTVFPWGKVDPNQIEADMESINNATANNSLNVSVIAPEPTNEDETKATVEAKVAQIMAETAELSAKTSEVDGEKTVSSSSGSTRFEKVTNFSPGVRLEAQDFDGNWHTARIVEVDNDDSEVLIKFERSGKTKSTVVGTEEWIPMNSTRLRQKISNKPLQYELEEKCMARWSGPRKFPGTVKKILGNDQYEILFDDGYVKNVRAVHMSKLSTTETRPAVIPASDNSTVMQTSNETATETLTTTKTTTVAATVPKNGSSKKRSSIGMRKDWPLLDMAKLDLASLNLPEIPRDGEWTCHWVNDQPIGREGFLIVGEHRKPTVIVEDWRLPPGWVKHMYQRSNVLGKWDVILVTPNNKRFRSKADLKVYLEEQGQVYNPDIYDFSIHRRRAKDLNAYVYTPDYTPTQGKPICKSNLSITERKTEKLENCDVEMAEPAELTAEQTKAALESSLAAAGDSSFLETPVASYLPPMELMTSPVKTDSIDEESKEKVENMSAVKEESKLEKFDQSLDTSGLTDAALPEDGVEKFSYVGALKVRIINNLFRCPQEGCNKNFRKENHLQIHVKHYHRPLAKLLGSCPKMQELAEKRTFITTLDSNEPHAKNQIPNQQFFAKLHQQDMQQTRSSRKSMAAATSAATSIKTEVVEESKKVLADSGNTAAMATDIKTEVKTANIKEEKPNVSIKKETIGEILLPPDNNTLRPLSGASSPSKRSLGSRKSSRQRTTRHYFTPALSLTSNVVTADTQAVMADIEETRHAFNATPDTKLVNEHKRRKIASPLATDSPMTADSGSGSLPALASGNNETAEVAPVPTQPQYIKENGEIIKIVRMRQEEIINCLCQYGEEDGLMIQCELCLCWQHGICNGIEKESDCPEKYVCWICRNPLKARDSMRYKHDQDWLYEGKLPVANFHTQNPDLPKRFDFLKRSHTLTGNLIDLKRIMHSLRVKVSIANNRCHPKLYLWAKNWDEHEDAENVNKSGQKSQTSPNKDEEQTILNIPQPEAAIDSEECQQRLINHIKIQQKMIMKRLDDIELEVEDLEAQDDLDELKHADDSTIKEVLATFINELEVVKKLAKLNAAEHVDKQATA